MTIPAIDKSSTKPGNPDESAPTTPEIAMPPTRQEMMLAEVQRIESAVLAYLSDKPDLKKKIAFSMFLSEFSWLERAVIQRSVRQRLARVYPPSCARFSFTRGDSDDWWVNVEGAEPLQPANLMGLLRAIRILSQNSAD